MYGTIVRSPSADLVETIASGGFDYLLIDHVHSAIGWETAVDMIRAAHGCGLAVFYRPSSSAVASKDVGFLTAQCTRALSIGVDGLFVSVHNDSDMAAVVEVANEFWQRQLHRGAWMESTFSEYRRQVRNTLFLIAQFESKESLAYLEATASLDIDGLALANTDLSIEVTEGLDANDRRMVALVETVADLCRKSDLALWCNTGYGYPTVSEMRERADSLVARGASMILFQSAEFILLNSVRALCSGRPPLPHNA